MATTKPRLMITLEPEEYEILQRLAAVQGGTKSRIVSEMLAEVLPMLGKAAEAMEAAQRAQECMRASIRAAAEQAEQDMRPLVASAIAHFDHLAREMDSLVEPARGTAGGSAVSAPSPRAARGRRRKVATVPGPRPVITGATNANGGGAEGADGAAGVAWWNALTKAERAEWCRKTGSAVPADAWEAYKRLERGGE